MSSQGLQCLIAWVSHFNPLTGRIPIYSLPACVFETAPRALAFCVSESEHTGRHMCVRGRVHVRPKVEDLCLRRLPRAVFTEARFLAAGALIQDAAHTQHTYTVNK